MNFDVTAPTSPTEAGDLVLWRLLVLYSPEGGRRGDVKVLSGSEVTLGRGEAHDDRLALEDGEVSRAHARLARDGDEWILHDLGSRNGTYVEGERATRSVLGGGEVIRIGAHLLLLERLDARDCEVLGSAPLDQRVLVGDSVGIMRVRLEVATAGPGDGPVLVVGETGVGKELVAHELHRSSGRKGAFVPVNCAALPDNLVESELFGHVKGAFTGAAGENTGLFVAAHGGTLFLDEIGEMPLAVQAKLLRTLATGEVRAVGARDPRHVDARVVAATNVDLERAVEEGRFRPDLYSRLMGVTIHVPPLRWRRADILPLARHFLGAAALDGSVSVDAAEALVTYRWRFNVRELLQVVRGASLHLERGEHLALKHLPTELRHSLSARSTQRTRALDAVPLPLRIRRDVTPTADGLREVCTHFAGNIAQVAEYFGKDRRQIYRWAERLGVDLYAFRE